MEDKVYLSKQEVADYLGLSVPTINRLISSGSLPYIKLVRSVRIRREDIDKLIAQSARGNAL